MKPNKTNINTPQATKANSITRFYLLNSILYVLFFILAMYLTVMRNNDYLFKLQELSLFIPTKLFLSDTLAVPAGFLTYIGLFLTQFFYYPWFGSLILIALLITVQILTAKAFKLQSGYFPLSFVPSIILLLAISQWGYYIFTMYSKGDSFSHLIGTVFILGFFWAYRSIKNASYRLIFSLFYLPLFFHLLGFYALFTALLFIVFEALNINKQSRKIQLSSFFLSLLFIAIVPLLLGKYVYVSTMIPNIYIDGLPKFSITMDNSLYSPFIVLFLFLCAIPLILIFGHRAYKTKLHTFCLSALILSITAYLTLHFSYNDENFKTELAMDRAISNDNWQEVIELADNLKSEPTRLIVMNTNLALRKMHQAGDRMFAFRNGDKPFKVKKPILLIEIAGKMLYYHYGQTNYCYRWCMEDMMSNGMKVDNLKYFVKSCLLNKEYELAGKYNRVLMKTIFHKGWAKKYQQFIDHPETIAKEPEFIEIAQLQYFENNLFSEDKNKFEEFLRYSFATATAGTQRMMELSLQCILEYKNDKAFWPIFMTYANSHSEIPIHYQEAALLFYSFQGNIDMSKIHFNQKIIDGFKDFAKMKAQYNQYSNNQQKEFFAEKFGKTYWYYYFFS